ncbi:chemotaxis protein MotB [Azospirillaceae bacterium]
MASGGSRDLEAPVIIKKKRKGGHDAHHGGAWKVAYADFVTAMMAFFLLLWLLNTVTSDQKKGLADYFAPASLSRSSSGSGGLLGGKTVTSPGAQVSANAPITANVPLSDSPGFAVEFHEDADDPAELFKLKRQDEETTEEYQSRLEKTAQQLHVEGRKPGETLTEMAARLAEASPAFPRQRHDESRENFRKRIENTAQQFGIQGQKPGERLLDFAERVARGAGQQMAQQRETTQFQQTANEIRQAIQAMPELQQVSKSLILDQTPDGLRIQIVDQDQMSMFSAGSNQMTPQARQLMELLAKAISRVPNKISITGNTDSTPFTRGGAGRDNWDLSSERANASRRILVGAGIPEQRVLSVVGRADRDLLFPTDPKSPSNRRISIVLLREGGAPAATGGRP